MSEMTVIDKTGDTKTVWDPANEDEVAVARASFNSLRNKGYLAYRVKEKGAKGSAITEFDPEAGSIILSPPMAGG